MDELKKLYDVLVRDGKYTKSFEEFQTKWSQDEQYKNKVYDVVNRDGIYTKDKDSFFKKYSVQPSVQTSVQSKKKIVSDSSLANGSSVSTKPVDKEEDYFTGSFGNVLRGFDSVVPLGIGDFVDDMARSVASGYRQGEVAQSANDLLLKGHKSTPEQIQRFIDANKSAQQLKPSAEMEDYTKIYENEGKGFWGVIKGLANNPSIIPEVLSSSLVSMATNTDALKAGGTAVGAGALRGAVVGAGVSPEFLGAGAIPGAVTGATSAVPYAFGLASSVVEAGATFGELLQEELNGKDLNKENVKKILEDPNKLNSIRNKAVARGLIIGTVDALTGKLAGGVGAKILSKSAAKSAAGQAAKSAVVKATAAGSAIESLGGSAGEAAARGAIGQDMDVSEIALEGLAELPGGARSTIQARLAKPSYKVNGAKVDPKELDELIDTMTPVQLASTKIEIKNDYAGREFKIRDKILTYSVSEEVKKANPDLNEPSLNAIVELEKSLKSLEGNSTQTGKDKAAAIRQKIKDIQENQLEEEAAVETAQAETKPLETLNLEPNAIQEQSTTEVPVQSETITSETLAPGVSESGPQVVTEQATQEEVNVDSIAKSLDSVDKKSLEDTIPLVLEVEGVELNPSEKYSINDTSSIAEAYKLAKADGSNPKLVDAVESLIPKVITEQATPKAEVTAPQTIIEENTTPISEALNDASGVYVYDGKKGQLATIGQTVVLETPTEIIDLGNVDELSDSTLADFGIQKEEESDITLNEDNSISVNGNTYLNNYSNPEAAISQDKDGNYSVTLDTENGQKRTFRGQQADQIVYQMKLKNFEQNGTEQQIEQANELADEAIRIEEENGTPSTERKGKTVRKAKRNKRNLKQPKENVSLPTTTVVSDVNELLDLDTKDKGSLQRVLDFLDKADDILKLDPNELNDVTRVMAIGTAKLIVKTLKTLVNAGITLKEAIEKVADIYNVKYSQIIDALDIVSKINENISEGISEMEAPGYNQLSKDIDDMIANDSNVNDTLDSVKDSDVYKNATDVQKDLLVRDVRKRFGLRQKSAPSVAKLFGTIKDVKKITMREKDLLVKQIKDKAKGAKEAVAAFKKINQELAKDISELVATGKITAKQASSAINRFSKVNPFSNKSVTGFVDYMSKVFENADYANNLSNAKSLRKDIKKLSKNDKKNAQLTNLASEFVNIDPSIVDNIEDYNEQASKLKKSIEGSNLRGGKLNVADTVDINEVSGYVAETMEQQENKIREQKIAELQDLLGVDASEFSAEEVEELLKPETKIDKDKEKTIRASIKKAFDIYSSMIKEQVKTGIDAFTGDDVSYTEAQKDLIKRFMAMDPNNMDVKDSLAAIDSLVNFLVNKSTARMETVLQQYEKTQNAKEIAEKGITSVPLRKYFSPKLGRFLAEQTSNIGLLLEKAFVGFNRSAAVKKAMGYYDLANGASKALSQSNKIVDDYVKQFYNKKANGQEFNTLYNMSERGMTAFVIRNIIGNESKSKAEFERRKVLVKESIDGLLEYGNEQEKKEGAEYQKVYDKILKDSNSAEEVMSKVDNQNLEAVNWWIDQWSGKFDSLSDLALNIYNTVLGRDVNYTPDKFKAFSSDEAVEDLSSNESSFVNNTDGVTYKKESSGLMKATRPESLPTNEKTKTPKYYIDLSFDKVNANAMHNALVDIETAAPTRGIEAFMNSPYFRQIVKSPEDAKLIRGRINNYIRNTRNKSTFSNDELSSAFRALNKIATLGASQALGGPSQPFKQVIPVAFNTLINSGGRLELAATFNPDFMKWFKDSGFATGNRGIESLAEIESINRLVEQAADSKGAKFWKLIEKANEKQLKVLLSNPDRWIAITSWKTYYEQSLRKQGLKPDYTTGEVNETAENYAEEMVSRQQNVSDKNMSGNLFTAKDTPTTVLVKLLMPFGSFRMNQSSRLGSDMRVLEYWNTSTKEDKLVAARSLAGFAVEQVAFKAIALAFAIAFDALASKIMDVDDDDEEKEKRRKAIYKGQTTGIVTDIFSPLPIFDKPIQGLASFSLGAIQEGMDVNKKDIVELYGMGKEDFAKGLGMFGISISRGYEIYKTIELAATGKYKDDFGRTKEISEDKKNKLSKLIGPMLVSNVTGIASPEVSSVIRNSVRYAKKKGLTSEQREAKEQKIEEIEQLIEKANTPEEVESLEKILEKQDDPEQYANENKDLDQMKKELLYDEEKNVQYDNQSDLKRYDKKLWEKNFGPDSEYYKLTIDEKNANKKIKEEIRYNKDEKYNYRKPVKKIKNKDGSYKKSYSSSKSSTRSESYDSNGVRTVRTKTYGKKYSN